MFLADVLFTFTFNHLADTFIQSDLQMRRAIEAISPTREQLHVARFFYYYNFFIE